MTGRPWAAVVATMLWWAAFGSISVSRSLASPCLVDTLLQGVGLRLAHERPTWLIVVVPASGPVHPWFGLFCFSPPPPAVTRAPRLLRLPLGLVLGMIAAIFLVEYLRSKDTATAWKATVQALKAYGWTIAIELVAALASATLWGIGVALAAAGS